MKQISKWAERHPYVIALALSLFAWIVTVVGVGIILGTWEPVLRGISSNG